jgi:GMP synthase-like glutamine amidotransferase
MRRLLVLQHIECEPPGAYEDELLDRGGTLVRVLVDEGEPLPDWRKFDGIVAMGGPMGAYEDDRLPWLKAEKALIAEAVMGESALPRLLEDLTAHEREMTGLARRLFGAWLEHGGTDSS